MLHVVRQLQSRFPGRTWTRPRSLAAVSAAVLLLGLAVRAFA
ncbi:MAG TPA: hypothetical protein VGD42_16255 [Lysobacter sp.]